MKGGETSARIANGIRNVRQQCGSARCRCHDRAEQQRAEQAAGAHDQRIEERV